ncbi:hypothetical protein CBR_g12386 [Chara braunii]|uniref:Riboflavin biosynthesis protein PYRD, chloroplastic n=1 Tax=Chara braunii TaxID=69332 RepID=A0A388KS05_CHABU|nr:hypothetical protein CBR_g12386 [Chara braunii]|eukprot:GBG72819.1 hypothetical protein CBR_g12386 [Chara braunii]
MFLLFPLSRASDVAYHPGENEWKPSPGRQDCDGSTLPLLDYSSLRGWSGDLGQNDGEEELKEGYEEEELSEVDGEEEMREDDGEEELREGDDGEERRSGTFADQRQASRGLAGGRPMDGSHRRKRRLNGGRMPAAVLPLSPPPGGDPQRRERLEGDAQVSNKPRVIVLAGPTGVGKSTMAVELAKRIGGEIISADSVQVYKGLDVGSAKVPVVEREGIPHHMLDVVSPLESYTAGDYFEDARAVTEDLLSRGKVPIVVGGTGMYLRWYIHGKPALPMPSQELRAAIEAEMEHFKSMGEDGWDAAVAALSVAGDPESAAKLLRNDWFRMKRCFEILRCSGKPRSVFRVSSETASETSSQVSDDALPLQAHQSEQQRDDAGDQDLKNRPESGPGGIGSDETCVDSGMGRCMDYDFHCYFLFAPRTAMYRRIDARCEEMVMDGLLKEASWLLDLGVMPDSSPPSRAIGYRQAMEYLQQCRKELQEEETGGGEEENSEGGALSHKGVLKFVSDFQQCSRRAVSREFFCPIPPPVALRLCKCGGEVYHQLASDCMQSGFDVAQEEGECHWPHQITRGGRGVGTIRWCWAPSTTVALQMKTRQGCPRRRLIMSSRSGWDLHARCSGQEGGRGGGWGDGGGCHRQTLSHGRFLKMARKQEGSDAAVCAAKEDSEGLLWDETAVSADLNDVDDDDRKETKEEKQEEAMYIRRCVDLALQALGHTSPNPVVGCVIVKGGRVIGEGFHPKAGEPHAEVFALRQAGENAVDATAYVSLEPCNHYGRTPPCSLALVKARVKRVVVGALDPNPLVSGQGVKTLRDAGIEVVTGVEEELCQRVNEAFFHRMLFRKPFGTLRYAMSLDGKVVRTSAVCQSLPPEKGCHYSKLLQAMDSVVITSSALLLDPQLLSSEEGAKQPLRVLLLDSLDVPLDLAVFDTTKAPTVVVTTEKALVEDMQRAAKEGRSSTESKFLEKGVEMIAFPDDATTEQILDVLYNRGACSVLWDSQGTVEHSGVALMERVLEEKEAQKVVAVIVPVISGRGHSAVNLSIPVEGLKLERCVTSRCGDNIIIEGYLPNQDLLN